MTLKKLVMRAAIQVTLLDTKTLPSSRKFYKIYVVFVALASAVFTSFKIHDGDVKVPQNTLSFEEFAVTLMLK